MSTSKREESGVITWRQVERYVYIGTLVVGIFLYISSIKTDVEVMKNDINNMKEMIKNLHDQHIKDNGPVGVYYDYNRELTENCFFTSYTPKNIPPQEKETSDTKRTHILWVDNRKKLVDNNDSTDLEKRTALI